MAFHRAKTWKEKGLQVGSIRCKCNRILCNLGLPEDDARILGIKHVSSLCLTLAEVPFKLFYMVYEADGKDRARKDFSELLGASDLDKTLDNWECNTKCAFVTMVQFALENSAHRVLKAIGEKVVGKFGKDVGQLAKATDLVDKDRKCRILKVPASMRNSLHAGGISRYDQAPVDIDGEQYVFEEGKEVACASWSHIIHAFDHCLDIYEEMFSSPIVKAVNHIPAE